MSHHSDEYIDRGIIIDNLLYYTQLLTKKVNAIKELKVELEMNTIIDNMILMLVFEYEDTLDRYKHFYRLFRKYTYTTLKIEYTYTLEDYKAIPLYNIVSDYTELRPINGGWVGKSPFNDEKTPSFRINKEKNLYYCFSTNQGGNTIKFFQHFKKVDFKESLNLLKKYI